MILALLAVEEILMRSVSTSSTPPAAAEKCRSGVETEVVRLEDGPEKLNALFNREDKDCRFSTVATGGTMVSSVDFPSGEGTRGECCCCCCSF
jgi:hypothetical protein